MSDVRLLDIGLLLFIEWIKTFFIFTIIDIILIRRKITDIIYSHDAYISSLIVAAFLIIARSKQLSIFTFLIWALITTTIYTVIKTIFKKFLN